MRAAAGLLAAALALAAQGAAAFTEEDWPCQQRRIDRLSLGQVWSGAPPADPGAWRDDAAIAALAPLLAARRTGMAQAQAAVADFAREADADRMALLFAGTFALIDAERARLVEGVGRFARSQRALSERIDARRLEVDALRAAAGPKDFDALDAVEEAEAALVWETRIYQDRQRSVAVVCESPVLLERRAFELGRIIAAATPGG